MARPKGPYIPKHASARKRAREMAVMHQNGMTPNEIAEATGCCIATVYSRLPAGYELLRLDARFDLQGAA